MNERTDKIKLKSNKTNKSADHLQNCRKKSFTFLQNNVLSRFHKSLQSIIQCSPQNKTPLQKNIVQMQGSGLIQCARILTPRDKNQLMKRVLNGEDLHFESKTEAVTFINEKFSDFSQEIAGSRSCEGWHFDKHPVNGSAGDVEHINIYSKTKNFRVHITWG